MRFKVIIPIAVLAGIILIGISGQPKSNKGFSGSNLYTSADYGFSLEYPSELDIAEFYEEESETIVFQKRGDKKGFQIFITPYIGEQITREKILEDLPSTIVKNPTEAIIGENIRALIFWSDSSEIGKTREVWFTQNGYLFEISAYAELDEWLAEILKTWKVLE